MRLGDIGVADCDDRTHVGYPGDVWHYAWTQMIIAARSGGIDAIDGPYANFANPSAASDMPRRCPSSAALASGASTPARSR